MVKAIPYSVAHPYSKKGPKRVAKKSKVTLESLQLMLKMHQDGRLVMPDMMLKQIEKEIERRLALEASK